MLTAIGALPLGPYTADIERLLSLAISIQGNVTVKARLYQKRFPPLANRHVIWSNVVLGEARAFIPAGKRTIELDKRLKDTFSDLPAQCRCLYPKR